MADLRKDFGKLYDRYINKIYRFIFLKVNSQDIAQDLTSEVFLRAWGSYRQVNGRVENAQAFLYQIAKNLVVDHYRTKAQMQAIPVELATWHQNLRDTESSPVQQAILKSDMNTVQEALARINDDYREVIVLHYLDELSVPEIAKVFDKSEEAVRVMIHRALRALKDVLGCA